MLDYIKKLITPDMVSLWVPSGLNRAQDLIRGNHGQCYGTHPNVPVLPSLINPSLGWHFDGVDDTVNIGDPTNGNLNFGTDDFSIGMWMEASTIENAGIIEKTDWFFSMGGHGGGANKIGFLFREDNGSNVSKILTNLVPTQDTWYLFVIVVDRNTFGNSKVYSNSVDITSSRIDGGTGNIDNVHDFEIGTEGSSYLHGYIALPFVTRSAWSAQQVSNFYLATKGLFAPRG